MMNTDDQLMIHCIQPIALLVESYLARVPRLMRILGVYPIRICDLVYTILMIYLIIGQLDAGVWSAFVWVFVYWHG